MRAQADTARTGVAMYDVIAERGRVVRMYGEQESLPFDTRFRLIGEEVGEVARALNDREPRAALREELVQTAALAVAWVEAIDRGDS